MQPNTLPRVAVVGGSLGGLTAALLLRDLGCEVDVYERSAGKLQSFGAGIVVHPATMRYFRERSSIDPAEICVPSSCYRFVDGAGRMLHEEPSPYRFTSWGTLHRSLLRLFGRRRYHGGYAMAGIEANGNGNGDGVEVAFSNGQVARCDLLVCADGIGSTARELLSPQTRPVYAGYVGWRGTVAEERLSAASAELLVDAITYGVLDHSHLLVYPIQGSTRASRRLLNFVWYWNVAPGELDEMLVDRGGRAHALSIQPGEMQGRFVAALHEAAGDLLPAGLRDLVRQAEAPFIQAVVDVAVDAMAYGRVCLVGDAAFAARPHAAAGTAKAAANDWALADALAEAGDVEAALAAWEPAQLALGRALVERSREIGERYQVSSTAVPGDPALRFGLHGPDD